MKTEKILKLFEHAQRKRQYWDNIYKDSYKYGIPNRDMFNVLNAGVDKNFDLYDSTLADSTRNFANSMHEGMTPPEQRWFEFAAGVEVPANQKEKVQALLDAVTERYFQLLWQTNFDTEVNQCYYDLAVGTASIGIRDYDDGMPATFLAVPPYELYILEGRQGFIDTTFRVFKLEARQIKVNWPDATFNEEDFQDREGKNREIELIEATYYDHDTKKIQYQVIIKGGVQGTNVASKSILKKELLYNNWVVFRWSVVSGEIYGRGPIINALPDAKTANKTVELVLKNASIAVSGIWTAVDDGVINPETIELEPGVIIPVAYNGGSVGRTLDSLSTGADFNVSDLVLNDLRQSIRRKMFDDDLAPLDDAVRSSREVALRQARLAKKIGPNFGRTKMEFLTNFIKATTQMWIAKGELPPFEIDGKMITVRYTSPIAQEQNDDDLLALDGYLARLNAHTPGLGAITVPPHEYAHYTGEKMGIPFKLIESKQRLIQAQQAIGQDIAQGGEMGAKAVEAFTSV